MSLSFKLEKKNYFSSSINILLNLGYGEHLEDKGSVEFGTKDYNRRIYLMRHLLSLHEAIW